MEKHLTIKEQATEVRKNLKAKYGLTSRDISVTVHHILYDDKLSVYIKSLKALPFYKGIEKLANEYKFVDYDERSGEILLGGNTYVHVHYDYNLLEDYATKYQAFADEIFPKATNGYMTPIKRFSKKSVYFGIVDESHMLSYKNSHRVIKNSHVLAINLAMIDLFDEI